MSPAFPVAQRESLPTPVPSSKQGLELDSVSGIAETVLEVDGCIAFDSRAIAVWRRASVTEPREEREARLDADRRCASAGSLCPVQRGRGKVGVQVVLRRLSSFGTPRRLFEVAAGDQSLIDAETDGSLERTEL